MTSQSGTEPGLEQSVQSGIIDSPFTDDNQLLMSHIEDETSASDMKASSINLSNKINNSIRLLSVIVPNTPETSHLHQWIEAYLVNIEVPRSFEVQAEDAEMILEDGVTQIDESHEEMPGLIDAIVDLYTIQYKRLGKLSDLNMAILFQDQLVSVTPEGHEGMDKRLNDIELLYRIRFQVMGNVADIQKAMDFEDQRITLNLSELEGGIMMARKEELPSEISTNRATSGCDFAETHPKDIEGVCNYPDFEHHIHLCTEALSVPLVNGEKKSIKLNKLGRCYHIRFLYLGNLSDVDAAIQLYTEALSLSLEGGETKPRIVSNLGLAHLDRFEHLGDVADIHKSIECHIQAAAIIPKNRAHQNTIQSYLGNSYHSRFRFLGNIADIEAAIDCQSRAISLTTEEDETMASIRDHLGASLLSRFHLLGRLEDVQEAIEQQSLAVLFSSEKQIDRPAILSNLGLSHANRFKRLGDPLDIEKAIEYQSKAVLMTGEEHRSKPTLLSNLSSSYSIRFERLGDPYDMDKAIVYLDQALSLTHEGHKNKHVWVGNLGNSHHNRFKHSGRLDDIEKAITYQSQAISLISEKHLNKPHWLHNLGLSYRSRFEQLGKIEDIDKAIECHNQAVQLTPEGHADITARLNSLGMSHFSRFEYLNDYADIDKAAELLNMAVSLLTEEHPDRPEWLIDLGIILSVRFEILDSVIGDINRAIEIQTLAVSLIREDHASAPKFLDSLGVSHYVRFGHLKEQSDIDKAIEYQGRALSLTSEHHAYKSTRLNNLAKSHAGRFELVDSISDLEQAIEYQRHAVSLVSKGRKDAPKLFQNLGTFHETRFSTLGENSDIENAIDSYKVAAQLPGQIAHSFKASRQWARLSLIHQTSSAIEAYEQLMTLVPRLVWLGRPVAQRYETITEIGDVATEAAAVAITSEDYDLALEWLEQGRSIVWSQRVQLRTPLDELEAIDPLLAGEIRQVAHSLEQNTSSNPTKTMHLVNGLSREKAGQRHRQLAAQWKQLLERARLLPGYGNFLRPRPFTELARAAKSGVIVVINVHELRCDALGLLPGYEGVVHIPLPLISYEKCLQMRTRLLRSLQGANARDRQARRPVFHGVDVEDHFEEILATLWNDIVKPILDGLGFLKQKVSTNLLPHITWCTTGPLAFLPLHAAGCYSIPNARVYDYAVSSYTPTISALLQHSRALSEFHGILAVGQAAAPGTTSLPGTVAELDFIQGHAAKVSFTRLEGHSATPGAVLSGMENHSWVHLACHAAQNAADPTKSAFQLYDGVLDLAMITQRNLKHPVFAFLSACQTATGDESLPEEAVHLAAGMMMIGYQSVIATMWSIMDEDAPLIADKLYTHLLKGNAPDKREAAMGLHLAIESLRNKVGVMSFARWVPFMHIGQ